MASHRGRVDRTERLLNLVICLMAARVPVRRATIRGAIPGYAEAASETAFERMFERDKDELRAMGIPVETVVDVHGDVLGYRVRVEDYELPPIRFSPQERAVLAIAATLWDETTLGPAATSALRKLEAAQPSAVLADGHDSRLLVRSPDVARFALPLITALRERRSVEFGYRATGASEARCRRVDPWGIVARDGAWYLVGHDRDRRESRVFRLSRIEGSIETHEEPDVVARPDDVDLSTLIIPVEDDGPVEARVIVRDGRGAELRRHGMPPDTTTSSVELTVRAPNREQLVGMICAAGDGARLAMGQEPLAVEVRAALQATVERHSRSEHGES